MIQTTLFISSNDPQLNQIKSHLSELQSEYPHQLHIIDIDRDQDLIDEFADKAPVLDVGVYRLLNSFSKDEMRFAFAKADERMREAREKGNDVLVHRITKPISMTKSDRFSRWFSNNYMVTLNLFTFFYVFFAIFAPVLMQIGWELPGRAIYKIYSPLCHQLAFRSFFIFGEQSTYPRDIVSGDGIMTYAQATGFSEFDINTARNFLGNDVVGYKIALCQRDIAIYGAIFMFGLIFSLTGNKIKPLPWYLWILIGLGPIGLDGFSQLLSQTGLTVFQWIPLRESTAFLRVFTGALFGLATAWFGFPYLEESVMENRREMALKHAIVQQISEPVE